MGLASTLNSPPMRFQSMPLPGSERILLGGRLSWSRPINQAPLPHRFPSRSTSTLVFARRRNNHPTVSSSSRKKNKERNLGKNDEIEDEDAIEALFKQLEEDLKNDDEPSVGSDIDEDITEEDIALLEQELSEAFGPDEEGYVIVSGNEDKEEEEEEEEEKPLKLRNWQRRRLASALKEGRRKVSIKNLAAELCLDRAVVLELLREPPPDLMMMSAVLSDEPALVVTQTEPKSIETDVDRAVNTEEPDTTKKVPIHVRQKNFSLKKRLKKAHAQTLEAVYRRTKRPTNTIISSIVQVTNLPRRRIVKWFEDKRAEDGVLDSRLPYQLSVSSTIS